MSAMDEKLVVRVSVGGSEATDANTRHFPPRDIDDVDRLVRAGRVRRVEFARLEDLLSAIWREEADLAAWRAAQVDVAVDGPGGVDAFRLVQQVADSYVNWRGQRRRARAVAGTILGLLAALAAFGFAWWCMG